MARTQKVVVLMVRNPKTDLHRFGGDFTQKQHLWATLERLGFTTSATVFDEDKKLTKDATYANLCKVLRDTEFGKLIVIQTEEDEKAAVLSQVEVNEYYKQEEAEDETC